MARALVQTTIPHRETSSLYFRRVNGDLTLTIVGHPDHGLPYGKLPRLLLAWLSRHAQLTRSRLITLEPVRADLLRQLGLSSTGGRTGTIRAVDDQLLRLLKSTVHIDWNTESRTDWRPFQVSAGLSLWRDRSESNGGRYWIELSQPFFDEVIERSVPLDFATLRALRSPLSIDLYAWATDRVFRLNRPTTISWQSLQSQFGAEYARSQDFRRAFILALGRVSLLWPQLRAKPTKKGLLLRPCEAHVSPRIRM